MKAPPTNLLVLKKSRRKPEAGDVFVFQLEQFPSRYFFGRVIATDTSIGGIRDFQAILIYIYRHSRTEKSDIPDLYPADLLVAPIATNAQPWSRGYFEFVVNRPLSKGSVLSTHCFKDVRGRFLDEYGRVLNGPAEPVGVYGVSGIGAIDDKVSRALGVPRKEPREDPESGQD